MDNLGVRIATPDEVDDVMEAALRACAENGFVNPNPLKLLHEVWAALHLDNGIVGVIGEKGKLEGGILLRVITMWYSDDQALEEKAIFVHPDYRGAQGGRASRLCEFAKNTADQLGIPLLIGVLSNNRTEAKIRMYERQFGKPAGAFFLYGAQTGQPVQAAE
jgi:GNAT superfamily N-acetyltransferase